MGVVVFFIELLVEALVLQMIIHVAKEVPVITWIMRKGRGGGRTEGQCSCDDQRSPHIRSSGRDASGARIDSTPFDALVRLEQEREFPSVYSRPLDLVEYFWAIRSGGSACCR
jgi:hypothetical protein